MHQTSSAPGKLPGFFRRNRLTLAGALVGALVFVVLHGVRVLDPSNADWILNLSSSDPSQHYLGWEFFRDSVTRLPYLGLSYQTVYPFRTSIIFSDSIPLLALLFKPFGALLPTRFQYLGLWGLFCYSLQGALGQLLTARIVSIGNNRNSYPPPRRHLWQVLCLRSCSLR